jgi:hypothetical protein
VSGRAEQLIVISEIQIVVKESRSRPSIVAVGVTDDDPMVIPELYGKQGNRKRTKEH